MNKQLLMKTAVGLGLVAGSLTASATIEGVSFGSPMIFAHSGSTPYYGLFLPSGSNSSDAVVLVEAVQGATSNTWSYVVGAETLGPTTAKFSTDRGAPAGMTGTNLHDVFAGFIPGGGAAGGAPSTFSGTMLMPAGLSGAQVITYPFAQTTALTGASSAVNCQITFEASINSGEDLFYAVNEMRPQNWGVIVPTANATFAMQTGAAASNSWAGTWSDYFGAYNGAGAGNPVTVASVYNASLSGVANASAYATISISAGGFSGAAGALATSFAFGSIGQQSTNLCFNARRAREGLNNSGLIGGSAGMIKIW